MGKTLKIILISTIFFFVTVLTLMLRNVLTFGWGLGDLFYFYIQILWLTILVVFLVILIFKTSNFSILISRIISFILILSTLLTIKAFTIGRGSDYPWNGKIFTTYNEKLSEKKTLQKVKNDTLVIENRSAIIYEPTDERINKLKKEVGEEDFYIAADDYLFYLNDSYKYLESQKMKIVMTKNDKVLKFILADKSITTIKLDLEKEIWGIYLFDPKQKPKKIDMTATADEFKEYTK